MVNGSLAKHCSRRCLECASRSVLPWELCWCTRLKWCIAHLDSEATDLTGDCHPSCERSAGPKSQVRTCLKLSLPGCWGEVWRLDRLTRSTGCHEAGESEGGSRAEGM